MFNVPFGFAQDKQRSMINGPKKDKKLETAPEAGKLETANV